MKSIKVRARFLELISLFIGLPVIVIAFFYKWTYGTISDFSFDGFHASFSPNPLQASPEIATASLPLFARALGILVDGIGVGLLIMVIFKFISIMRAFQRGETFSQHTMFLFTRMSRFIFVWAIYDFFKSIPLSLATTICNPAGHHVLAVSITSSNISNIFIVGCFLVISSIIYEGVRLKDEQDLTV
jgi:uncharacterized membrane protein YidH (DUF202 family)